MNPNVNSKHHRGFALIVTLSLMILLTIMAVGLLTLSSISLRAAGQGEAMAVARSNARLALMLALGDLQKLAGPDKAITATSGILSNSPGKPHLTGVWESWDYNPAGSALNYDGEKDKRFRHWLVSTPQPSDATNRAFGTSGWSGETIELVGDGALGDGAPASARISAGRVPVSKNNVPQGGFAWHVSDESVKARINLYRDPRQDSTLAQQRALLAGHRPDPSVIHTSMGGSLDFLPNDLTDESFSRWEETVAKAFDLNQIGLLDSPGNQPGRIKAFRNDVTPYSLGLLTNVRNGGLKMDLSSVFEMSASSTSVSLPDEFKDRRLYESTHGITGVSDPNWSALQSYYNSFRGLKDENSDPTYYQPLSQRTLVTNLTPPTRFYPAPVIEKVETLFSYVTRQAHDPWDGTLKQVDPKMVYMGHLVFTPLITLHNPYNISISFDSFEVTMANVPVAFNFYVNDKPQSSKLVPLNDLFIHASDRGEIKFVMNIGNWRSPGSSSTSGPIVMKPGQSLVCGPYLNPGASFDNHRGTPFFDWRNHLTANIYAKPGFAGRCVGYDLDWLTPTHGGYNSGQQTDQNKGVLGLRATDSVRLEYAVQQPSIGQNSAFQVTAKINIRNRSYEYGGLDFKYQDNATLKKLFPETYRYPASGSMTASSTYVPNSEAVSRHARAQTVGIFSAYARTTSGGVFDNGSRTPTAGARNFLRDGRLAGKPFLFHNPARPVVSIDLTQEKPGAQSHELNFQQFVANGQVDDYFNIDSDDDRTACLTGNTTQRGIKSGSYLELPTGPMQTIADFRRSNALTTSYLPNFVQPVANSQVSPLMDADKVTMTDTAVAPYELLDHSVLANHALYDNFYFSTFATVGNDSPETVFENFLNGGLPLPCQAFEPYLPGGETISGAKSKLFSAGKPADTAYQSAAAYQMVRGAFNVNSTNVQAWKAMLASINKGDVVTLWAKSAGLEVVKATGTPILPMSLINGGVVGSATVDADKIDDQETNEWNGHQELTDTELENLAAKIVDEVRARGPFLSMSEFVNRRIGANSELTRMGALEAAIEKSGINNDLFKTQVPIEAKDIADSNLYPYNTAEASVGNPAAGAPAWVSQGDLLRLIEPAATVRSDTFVIRVCGEAEDAKGNLTARVYAEAVVQRLPEYVDALNDPSVNVYTDASASAANKSFGRRVSVVSFRWLDSNEI
jgi:type II secretory pathway pseudopilin PulG